MRKFGLYIAFAIGMGVAAMASAEENTFPPEKAAPAITVSSLPQNIRLLTGMSGEGHSLQPDQIRALRDFLFTTIETFDGLVRLEDVIVKDSYQKAVALYFSHGPDRNMRRVIPLLMIASQKYPEANLLLGYCYFGGDGVPRNYSTAATYFHLAALAGNVEAQFMLGYCYYAGLRGEKDFPRAFAWFQKAAESEYPDAQVYLGIMYHEGEGVEKNEKAAVSWFQKAAAANDAFGEYNLGISYLEGVGGLEQNFEQGLFWLQKAADQNLPDALYELGVCHAEGIGCEPDPAKAFSLWQKAVELNPEYVAALEEIADCYKDGTGVMQDLSKYEYYKQKIQDLQRKNAM